MDPMAGRPLAKVRDIVVLITLVVMAILCAIMAAAALLSQGVLADAANGDIIPNTAPGQSTFVTGCIPHISHRRAPKL